MVVSLIVGAIVLFRPAKTTTVVNNVPGEPSAGSMAGPVLPYDYICVGGLCTYSKVVDFRQATTSANGIVCAIQSPNATSTLVSAGGWTSGSTTASKLIMTRSKKLAAGAPEINIPYAATTTPLSLELNLAANTPLAFIASTTGGGIGLLSLTTTATSTTVFNPGEWFLVSQQGGHAGWEYGFGIATDEYRSIASGTPLGSCYAKWEAIAGSAASPQ